MREGFLKAYKKELVEYLIDGNSKEDLAETILENMDMRALRHTVDEMVSLKKA